jgi:hypothetical protein
MFTATFNGAQRYAVDVALRRLFPDFDRMDEVEQFKRRERFLFPFVQKMLKRLRAVLKMDVRYLCVAEGHKRDAFPHYHVLLHEQRQHVGVTGRKIRREWRDAQGDARAHLSLVFTRIKLVRSDEAAAYVAKYLGKSDFSVARASLKYGRREVLPHVVAAAGGGAAVLEADLADDPEALAPSVSSPSGNSPVPGVLQDSDPEVPQVIRESASGCPGEGIRPGGIGEAVYPIPLKGELTSKHQTVVRPRVPSREVDRGGVLDLFSGSPLAVHDPP